MTTYSGLDRLSRPTEPDDHALLRSLVGARVGVLAHAASVDHTLRPITTVLQDHGIAITALFGPEHGMHASAQDMIGVGNHDTDAVPVYSLYGETEESLVPQRAWLEQCDVVVIDLQDVGSRYYTYVWTAVLMTRAALAAGRRVMVLDRPNPLGGVRVEGAPQHAGYCSFVGLEPVAVRHGMTLAEIVRAYAGVATDEQLQCVVMRGWSRDMMWARTGLPWVQPSPNMPTLDTALVYPGGCLLEGTSLSEGRGTTKPFEIFGAPWLDANALASRHALSGATLRPLVFEPMFHKHAKQACRGVQVHVTDPSVFQPYETYLRLIAGVALAHPEHFRWRTERYEFVDHIPAIDLLTGSSEFRALCDEGQHCASRPAWTRRFEEWLAHHTQQARRFQDERRAHWLYR
jgi:uncharacterized protein YbbC (DUF1343 family)